MIETILWIYIALLLAGGLVGFIKAKSKASLIMSSIFACLLLLCVLRVFSSPHVANGILVFLLVFFGMRFAKGRKFMPAGLMTVVTALTLVVRLTGH